MSSPPKNCLPEVVLWTQKYMQFDLLERNVDPGGIIYKHGPHNWHMPTCIIHHAHMNVMSMP